MAAGPSTPELVIAAASAGAMGFLAAGYKTAAAMTAEIQAVRAGRAEVFGINLFVPGAPAADHGAVTGYLASLSSEAAEFGVTPGEPAWTDDGWEPKVAALLDAPPPVVSFTFGCPSAEIIAAFRAAGSLVWMTVTSPAEAMAAAQAGADSLCVQGPEAGAHRGTFANADPPADEPGLVALIGATRRVTRLPIIAAGGICTRPAVSAALAAGASAVQCGTAFLRCPESGAHPAHKAALADNRFSQTAVTRAFTGRPARSLVNRFMLDHPAAPAAYPEIHNATRPLRAAAAAAGDIGRMNLWAGQGYREATTRPAAEIVAALADPPAQLG